MLSPFRGFRDTRSEVEQLMDEMFSTMGRFPGRQRAVQQAVWAPAVDVLSRDGDLIIKAELPGVTLEDVDITVQDGVLTISGQNKVEEEVERGGYHVRERRYGSFRRSMTLPEGTNEDQIKARFEDGVLEVVVEGAAAMREPKRIQIQSTDGEDSGDQNTGS